MSELSAGYLAAPEGTPPRPTGARPSPRHELAAAVPFRPLFAAPASWIWLPSILSYWNNQTDGCCVTTEEAFARACSGVLISDRVAYDWAARHGVLNGAVISEVLDWMHAPGGGFSQDGNVYGAGARTGVNYADPQALQAAIAAGPVKIGVAAGQLQNVVGVKNGWFGVGFRRDNDYDHCVSLCGYGTAAEVASWLKVSLPAGLNPSLTGYALFTWDTVGFIDAQSMLNVTCEAWLRTPTTVTQGNRPPTPDPVFTPQPAPPGPNPPPQPPAPPPAPAAPTIVLRQPVRAGQWVQFMSAKPAGTYALRAGAGPELDVVEVE